MKIKKLLISFLILLVTSNVFASAVTKSDVIKYFNELIFGSEFGDSNKRCMKWTRNIKIFVSGKCPVYLDNELNEIIKEINDLIKPIKLSRVTSKRDSNYIIYFGSGKNYAKIEPNAKPYIKDNYGFFWVYWNSKNELFKGSMYVDMIRTKNKNARKHLLREELTQSLGIGNDSYEYPDSIFYQKWTHTINYLQIDKYVIKLLYNEEIKPNMTKRKVNEIIRSKGLIDIK